MSSYISVLLPAFHIQSDIIDKNTIQQYCSVQFETSIDNFELYELNLPTDISTPHIDYAIKFKESNLSLTAIEDLIYQRDCIRSICEKTFESLKAMTIKLNDLQQEITAYNSNTHKNDEIRKDLENDNIKLRFLLSSQIEYSDNFMVNTEKTLNTIKDEFQAMVEELETMRKKSNKSKVNNTSRKDTKMFGKSNTISGMWKRK